MITEHTLNVVATCPVDESVTDVYVATITVVDRVLNVEDILDAVHQETLAPAYQEAITEALAHALDAKVVTVGTHSGVTTRCEVDGTE